jgi:hypothetical protein
MLRAVALALGGRAGARLIGRGLHDERSTLVRRLIRAAIDKPKIRSWVRQASRTGDGDEPPV